MHLALIMWIRLRVTSGVLKVGYLSNKLSLAGDYLVPHFSLKLFWGEKS